MEIRGKSQSAVPELYKTTPFITLDERQKNLRERREILELKTIMRSNAVKDLHIAKKAGIAKATDQFTQKNEMARARNLKLINDLETCKQEFRVVSRSGGLKAEQYLESTVKDYVKQIENLFPAWKDQQAHVNVKKIQDLEQEKSFTDQRRQLAKDAFEKEQSLRKIIEQKRQDLAVAQLLEHNEEMERRTRRGELDQSMKEVDAVMLEEATKAGRAAVGKIIEVSGEEREEWVGSVRKMVERGAGTARGGGRGEGGGGGGSGSGVGGVGSVNGFDFEGHLAEQAALEANARIHSQWLSQQLLMAASTPGRLTLPLPTASTSEVYKEHLAGIVERDAVANTSKVNQSVKFHSPVTAGGVGSEGGGAGGGGRRVMQQTPYSAAADMNTTNASAVDMSMASVGGGRGTYEFRVSKEIFRGVGLESKMKLFESLTGQIGSFSSDFEFTGDGVSDYDRKSVIENGGEGTGEEMARTVMSDLVHSSRYDVIPKISTFQGQPAKILVNILKFQKDRNGELKRAGTKVDVGDLWGGILDAAIVAGGGEKALKKFWAPMFVDPMKVGEDGEEEDGDKRRRMIRKVVGVLKLAVEGRKNEKKRKEGGGGGGGGIATPNTSRYSALSNYEEFGDEDGGSSSGGGEIEGGGGGGGGEGEDEDEFDF
ncbi:hypothetical protein TrST_g4802 [Triparma strigata]|uniref:Uncharacterized protein n=1 Tax=Triparma strigata TaxID=1606541 RepID=A0A9W7EM26_9STRA|nr:hypothetical protein TrST_g4802 [Triparma strigata]